MAWSGEPFGELLVDETRWGASKPMLEDVALIEFELRCARRSLCQFCVLLPVERGIRKVRWAELRELIECASRARPCATMDGADRRSSQRQCR